MYKRLFAVMLVLVFMVGMSGCVYSGKSRQKESEAAQLTEEKNGLIQERDRLAQEKATLAKSVAGMETNLKALETKDKTLEAKNKELQNQNGALKAELADASKKYLLLEKETKEIAAAQVKPAKVASKSKKPSKI